MEIFGKYSGAPSELWDLTKESPTFWLSEASLQKTRRCYSCVFYGAIRQTNMATDSFNIYLSPIGVKSLNRFVINWHAGAKLIRHAHEYNGFVTLNASTIKNVMTCLKGTRGYPGQCQCMPVTVYASCHLIWTIPHKWWDAQERGGGGGRCLAPTLWTCDCLHQLGLGLVYG